MTRPKIANDAVTTLSTSVATISQEGIVLTSSVKFPDLAPGQFYYVTVRDADNLPEIMRVTAKTGPILTVVRGQDGTTPKTFAAGSIVSMNANAAYLESLASRDGSDAEGEWPIDISGKAATVDNGVYTVGDQTIGGNKTFSQPINADVVGDVTGNLTGNAATATLASEAELVDGEVSDGTTVNGVPVGYRDIPQRSISANYTFALGDEGEQILHPAADTTARTWTIPANASVAFRVGTCITLVNENGAGAITVAITTDTLYQPGTGATGSRTLASGGMCTLLKVTPTKWYISGAGLT